MSLEKRLAEIKMSSDNSEDYQDYDQDQDQDQDSQSSAQQQHDKKNKNYLVDDNDNAIYQSRQRYQQQHKNLKQWIKQLNQEYHSEDEGIEDYKIGGYHPCHIGEVLVNRYVLIQKLGWGHFSTVWLAKDFKYATYVAVKVMKSSPHYLEASYDEVQILQKIAKLSTTQQWINSVCEYKDKKPQQVHRDDTHVLNLLNCFLYKGPYGNHFCMVYEILGVNLLEVLKGTEYKGLSLDTVREITRQILIGLDFLNRICKIIHTDLKPQNVLVCLTDEQINKIVQDGQLNNKDVFKQRLKYYRQNFGFGDGREQEEQKEQNIQGKMEIVSLQKMGLKETVSVQTTLDQLRLNQLKKRLQEENLNKNTKKTIRKKIKKLELKIQQKPITQQPKKPQVPPQPQPQPQPQPLPQLQPQPKQSSYKLLFQNAKPKPKPKPKTIKQGLLSKAINPKLVFNKSKPLAQGFKIKIADLGNACWTHYHFATEIQTRQYRGPEVILGSKYNTTADLWSLACMIFQMLTGDLLFNPKPDTNEVYGKNDDHIAQMMELLGIFPKKFAKRCSKFRKYFAPSCKLKRVSSLQQWSIKDFMIAKYGYTKQQAQKFQQFMVPMLNPLPQKRSTAQKMLKNPWLSYKTGIQKQKMSKQEYQLVKSRDYDQDQEREEKWEYQSENQDAGVEDNNIQRGNAQVEGDSDDQWYGQDSKYKCIGNIKVIDHSFTDVGYTGYSQGIDLNKLDSISNWQFK